MLTFIDTHAHITDDRYDLNIIKKHWEEANISNVFAIGYNISTSEQSLKIAKEHNNIYAIVGIHPDEIKDYTKENMLKLKNLAMDNKVIAIGEIGLDYHYINNNDIETKKIQKELFVEQIKLADKLNLPIAIHVRDAIGDLIEVLKDNKQYLNNGGVVHCFSESLDSYKILSKLGFMIGVGGVVTFKNGKKLQEVVRNCDLNDIILETDCPYLAPEPHRGTSNEPMYIPLIAEKICELRNITMEELSKITNDNVRRLFPKFSKN